MPFRKERVASDGSAGFPELHAPFADRLSEGRLCLISVRYAIGYVAAIALKPVRVG